MGINLTSGQMGDLQRLFSTPIEQGEGNSYTPNTVNYNGTTWKKDAAGGYASLSDLYGDNQYKYTNYGQDGTFSAEGEARMSDWDPFKDFLLATGGLIGAGAFMGGGLGAFTGAGNPVLSGLSNTGAITSGTAGLTGAGTLSGVTSGVTSGATGGGGGVFNAAADSQLANTAIGPSALEGYTAAGTGGVTASPITGTEASSVFNAAKDSQLANEALNLPPVTDPVSPAIPVNGTTASLISQAAKLLGKDAKSITLADILKLAGGVVDKNAQENASDNLLTYLRERQAINDNMYKPGSDEYNALWSEMSRKDAAAGRNSQYGPRSVDLGARIAQLKMDANTRMTTGIGNLFKEGFDQKAGSNTGLLAALGDSLGDGSLDWLNKISVTDLTSWLGDLFKP